MQKAWWMLALGIVLLFFPPQTSFSPKVWRDYPPKQYQLCYDNFFFFSTQLFGLTFFFFTTTLASTAQTAVACLSSCIWKDCKQQYTAPWSSSCSTLKQRQEQSMNRKLFSFPVSFDCTSSLSLGTSYICCYCIRLTLCTVPVCSSKKAFKNLFSFTASHDRPYSSFNHTLVLPCCGFFFPSRKKKNTLTLVKLLLCCLLTG